MVFDGNYNEALEQVTTSNIATSTLGGLHVLNVRIRDESGIWGPNYKRTVYISEGPRDIKVTAAEYFWGLSDPGEGSGTSMLAFDGNFNEALETVIKSSATLPSGNSYKLINIRVKDDSGNWGPLFKRSIYLYDTNTYKRDMKISSAEFFWGLSDPGVGNAIPILASDGVFSDALESIFSSELYSSGQGLNVFNIRIRDESGNWGPLYKRALNNNLPLIELDIINLSVSDTLCYGDTALLEAFGGENFKWYNFTNPQQQFSNDTSQIVKVFPNTSSKYMLVADNIYSGRDTVYYDIYVEQLPVISTVSSADSICLGESVTFSTSGTDFFSWDNGINSFTNTITPSYDSLLHITGTSNFGCVNYDSVFIIVNYPTSSPTIFDTTCDYYVLNGQTYTIPGTYQQTLVNSKGCDSAVTLKLHVNYLDDNTIYEIACDSFLYKDSIDYKNTGVLTHLYTNRFGCDSLEHLDLTVHYTTFDTLNITSCESYFINQSNYYSTGTYHQTLVNNKGCDSLLTLNINITENSFGSDIVTACDSYTDTLGNVYTQSGFYTYPLVNSIGCDSLVTLSLDLKNSTYGTDYQTSCNSFTWMDGQNYNSSTNSPIYNLINSLGCDSIVNLDLIIINDINTVNSISVCDSFIDPNGQVYDSSGMYSYVLPASNGCDSVVSLDLDIQKSFSFFQDTVCSGPYQLNFVKYLSSGTYQQTIQNTVGCDSLITLDLIIQEDLGLSFSANQQVFLNPAFDVEFNNNSNNINQMNFTWDFGDGTSLQTNNSLVNHTYDFNGFYDVKLLATYNSTGCSDSLLSSEYILCMGGEDDTLSSIENYNPDVKLYPNPTNGRIYIDIGNYQKEFTVEVYDIAGKLILISSAQNIDISKHERGTYLFKIIYGDRSKTIRVVKH